MQQHLGILLRIFGTLHSLSHQALANGVCQGHMSLGVMNTTGTRYLEAATVEDIVQHVPRNPKAKTVVVAWSLQPPLKMLDLRCMGIEKRRRVGVSGSLRLVTALNNDPFLGF